MAIQSLPQREPFFAPAKRCGGAGRWGPPCTLPPGAVTPLPLQFSAAGTAFPQALLVDFQAAPSAPTRNQEEARAAPHFPGQTAAPPGQKKSPASMGRVLLKGNFFRRLLRRLPGRVGEIPVDALAVVLLQKGVGLGEVATAEKPPEGREGAGVGGLQD